MKLCYAAPCSSTRPVQTCARCLHRFAATARIPVVALLTGYFFTPALYSPAPRLSTPSAQKNRLSRFFHNLYSLPRRRFSGARRPLFHTKRQSVLKYGRKYDFHTKSRPCPRMRTRSAKKKYADDRARTAVVAFGREKISARTSRSRRLRARKALCTFRLRSQARATFRWNIRCRIYAAEDLQGR